MYIIAPPVSLIARSKRVVGTDFPLVDRLGSRTAAAVAGLPLKQVLLMPGTPPQPAVLSVCDLGARWRSFVTFAEPLPLVL